MVEEAGGGGQGGQVQAALEGLSPATWGSGGSF